MKDQPRTRKQARSQRYGAWAGHPEGRPFDEKRCAAHTMTGGRGSLPAQCSARPGHGPNNLYCAAHSVKLFPGHDGCGLATWWCASTMWEWTLRKVQIAKHTDDFVWVVANGRSDRTARRSGRSAENYFPTEKEAKIYMQSRAFEEYAKAKRTMTQMAKLIKKFAPAP